MQLFVLYSQKDLKEKRGQKSAKISWNHHLTSADFHLLRHEKKDERESYISEEYKRRTNIIVRVSLLESVFWASVLDFYEEFILKIQKVSYN